MTTAAPANTDAVYELALRVRSKRDLERFLDRLAEDYETNREVWENRSIPDFLISLADCSRRSEYVGTPGAESTSSGDYWQYMACLMLGASVVR
ncbi:MAG: hypothetical protein P4L83_01365 [Nevskia sp.]|nr:hypothetical protein [Nevskia sp.]